MKDTPINQHIVTQKIMESPIESVGKSTIRDIKKLIDEIEAATGEKYIRMEMGIPGLPPARIAIEAEIEALRSGIPAIYPDIFGAAHLKKEISRFVKLFLNIDVSPEGCVPTVGSMQAGFATFLTVNRMKKGKDTTLFIDPGFPVHKQQHRVLGAKQESFDVYNFRGDKLRDKLESYLSTYLQHSLQQPQKSFMDLFYRKGAEDHCRAGRQVRCGDP